jgi:sulfatase maturation enzyme AslB (radical SAM superfamily)
MKSYCPLPFNHLAIRPNGKVYPCCAFRWDGVPEDFNIQDPNVFNHPYLETIRDKMRNNEPVEGCSKCYENEAKSSTSTRQYFIKNAEQYGLSMDTNPNLVYLDLALSNTCNNKCRMCNPDLSTSWYSDWKALGRKIPKGILEQNTVLENYDLSHLRFIKIIGGEPLMEQAKFIDVLKRCDRSKLSILITTNATLVPNDELYSLLKECKICRINLSIDAYGLLNDFLRKGSKWEKTVESIRWFNDNFPNNSIGVHAVVSIYNINHIDKLYHFLKDNFPNVSLSHAMIDGPDWMHPRHLPEYAKQDIIKSIDILRQTIDYPFFNVLQSELAKGGDFRLFMKGDKQLSDIRNENWKDANPELYEMVKGFYE